MEIRCLVVSSVGSSTWGATDPEMTWQDMETILAARKVFDFRSLGASTGGVEGSAEAFASALGKGLAVEAIRRNGIPLILENSFDESVRSRLDAYEAAAGKAPIKAFVNVCLFRLCSQNNPKATITRIGTARKGV